LLTSQGEIILLKFVTVSGGREKGSPPPACFLLAKILKLIDGKEIMKFLKKPLGT